MINEQKKDMYQSIHDKVVKGFDVKAWHEQYKKDVEHRQATWDTHAKKCIRVRENKPMEIQNRGLPNQPDYKDKMYEENIIFKHIKHLVSDLTGSVVSVDLQNIDSHRNENTELLENEMNMWSAILDVPKQTASAIKDGLYTGMGYIRRGWDSRAVTSAFKTGQPFLEHVNCMKVYIDETTNKDDKTDMRHIFHVEKFHYKTMAKKYPELKAEFEKVKDEKGMVEQVLVQFKHEETLDCLTITDHGQEIPKDWIVPVSSWQEFLNKGRGNTPSLRATPLVEGNYSPPAPSHRGELGEYSPPAPSQEGNTGRIPETVEVSFLYKNNKVFWYEAIFFNKIEKVIQEPVWVGDFSSYHIFHVNEVSDSAYSQGVAVYLFNQQEMLCISLTTYALMCFKYNKPKEFLVSGALVDAQDYVDNRKNLDHIAEIDETWRQQNPNAKAVEIIPPVDIPHSLVLFSNILRETMEATSGVHKTVQGMPNSANESGVHASLLQAAASVYHKLEHTTYTDFLVEIFRAMMFDVGRYRDKPMYVPHLSIENQMEMVLVNDPANSPFSFEPERVKVFIERSENIEMRKQMDMQIAMQLKQMGAISTVSLLERIGETNPEREYQRAMQEQGVWEIMEYLKANPQAMQWLGQQMQGGAMSNERVAMSS